MSRTETRATHHGRGRLAWAAFVLAAASLASLAWACALGPLDIPVSEVAAALGSALGLDVAEPGRVASTVVLKLRLPRSVLAWLVGAGLGVSGCVFQGILRNPLADPFTIGVSTGAAFGASLAIFFGLAAASAVSVAEVSIGALPLAALAGALGALLVVLGLARAAGGLRRETLVLAGIVTATFLSALVSLLKALDEEAVSSIVFWIMGSFQGRGVAHLALFAPYFAAGLLLVALWSRELDILSLGSSQAAQLGLNVNRTRLGLLTGASVLAGAGVAVSGVIGFVGLIVPHACRMVLGAEHRPLLLASGLLGGLVTLWSDVAARSLAPGGAELPVGVVTAMVGGPFFCLVLLKKSRGFAA